MRFMSLIAAAAAGAGLVLTAGMAQAADASAGETTFKRKCAVCHSVEPGQNKVGPTLAGVFGRESGGVEGYRYSKGMMEHGVTWNAETLDAYILDPRGTVKGTKMAFPGLKKDDERADVIAYLETLGG